MLKDNKGITLIALVITIIVLLILAGVSIAMLTGNNGILTQATNAAGQTDVAGIKEKVELAVSGAYAAKLAADPTDTDPLTVSEVIAQYNSDNGTSLEASSSPFDITENGNTYTVTLTQASGSKVFTVSVVAK